MARAGLVVAAVQGSDSHRRAQGLVDRRYRWRGYGAAPLPPVMHPWRRTFTATREQRVLGTLTVAMDGPEGLNCERLFATEVAALRAKRARVCEFTRLAVDADAQESAQALDALFATAYTVACNDFGADTLLIEVNPRHVRYYMRRFAGQLLAQPRPHPGIGAPSALLQFDLWAPDAPARVPAYSA